MPSSTSNSEFHRVVPRQPWGRILLAVVALVVATGAGWELYCRSLGYRPTLNDSQELWALNREKVKGDSVVIIGDSRPWFDLDLDVLQTSLGTRPIQLAILGSCANPVLQDLANDPRFHGTVICSVTPGLFFAPMGPPIDIAAAAVHTYHTWGPSQRSGLWLSFLLEERLAFLKQDDLTLPDLLKRIPVANRPEAHVYPQLPPYFEAVDRDRRARMTDVCAHSPALQKRIQQIWLPLFTPPPPPSYVPQDLFMAQVGKAIQQRFADTKMAVDMIRARGGKVVFVRFPSTGGVKQIEDQTTPRSQTWDRLIQLTGCPGIHFEDFPELASFQCPEWSHLTAEDSVVFTQRLSLHLRDALGPRVAVR